MKIIICGKWLISLKVKNLLGLGLFIVKYKVDDTMKWYKARFVAKGYTQLYGIDYQKTFAPVAKMNSVRVLISLAATQIWFLY